jgi:hypothetical protein
MPLLMGTVKPSRGGQTSAARMEAYLEEELEDVHCHVPTVRCDMILRHGVKGGHVPFD